MDHFGWGGIGKDVGSGSSDDLKKVSLSELFRSAVMEQIEDDYDLKTYSNAMREFRKNPKTHSLDEVEKELGLA